ncbi:MAG: hypothetical protein KBT27_10150 [Prevotellaceae bacterium]|nr:hypothetical protein [Candidatus Faecinaster equi]
MGPTEVDDGKVAKYGEYFIFKRKDGSIHIYRIYDNVIGALREIAESIGFKYDSSWNTRHFGSKLIDEINK